MPITALSHFNQDIARARAILSHASPLPQTSAAERTLRSDLFRSAWMFAVGALDAYFCDAYTDVVAATIISKSRRPAINLPDWFQEIEVPIMAVLEEYTNENWRWRMAARKMMERQNVLSLKTIKELFNRFFDDDRRFFRDDLLDSWMRRPHTGNRLFGIVTTTYIALPATAQKVARHRALQKMQDRYADIFQRRHDCIHNCDRPRLSPQTLTRSNAVLRVIEDVEFLVHRCNEHIHTELRTFLLNAGCTASLAAQVGY